MTTNSFSEMLKEEILEKEATKREEVLSELFGILMSKDSFYQEKIMLKTEKYSLANRFCKNLKKIKEIKYRLSYIKSNKNHELYTVEILNSRNSIESLFDIELSNNWIVKGYFLSSGYLKDPNKRHSLDFFVDSEDAGELLQGILIDYDIKALKTDKKNKVIVYIRNSENILDLIIQLDGVKTFFKYEEITINKEINKKVNRSMNYELANETKKLITSNEQVKMIKQIDKYIGLDNLKEDLKITALTRLEKEEASLQELADFLYITKSGLRHRMRKLKEIYDGITEKV